MKVIWKDNKDKVKKYWIGYESDILSRYPQLSGVFKLSESKELLVKYSQEDLLELWALVPKHSYVILCGKTNAFACCCSEENMLKWCSDHYLNAHDVIAGSIGYYTSGLCCTRYDVFHYDFGRDRTKEETDQALKEFVTKTSLYRRHRLLSSCDATDAVQAYIYDVKSQECEPIMCNNYVVAHPHRFEVLCRTDFEDKYMTID